MNPMKRQISSILTACAILQTCVSGSIMQQDKVHAVTDYTNALVSNQGRAGDASAVIRGEAAEVIYDSTIHSNVLHLNGDAYGAGWLQLPALFETGCKDGFTLSMQIRLDEDAEDYTRLFQMSSIPFGTGAAPAYSSPDISVDIADQSAYRSSIFVGRASLVKDDGKHRAMFHLDAVPDAGAWHQITAVYATDGVYFYLDGELLQTEQPAEIPAVMHSLFTENILSAYVYNAIGHSVYTDHDLRASIDNVAFYHYALTEAQAKQLPEDAAYLYTFEPETIRENVSTLPEKSVSLKGASLTSIPSLQAASPDGKLITKIWTDPDGGYYYSVHKNDGTTVIEPSRLGIVTSAENLSTGFSGNTPSAAEVDFRETYSMPSGKHSTVTNAYHEISFPLIKGDSILTVILRLYDDGVGIRYALNHGAEITSEATEVVFPEKGTLWGAAPNPTYEWEIGEFSIQELTAQASDYSVPLTGKFSDSWVLLSEANVFNEETPYCAGYLKTATGSRALIWRFGNKVRSVRMPGSFCTPWRAAVIADDLNDLSSSELILNLNPPSVLEDTEWIHPGKVAWSWWSSGGDSPIEYHMQKDYIDFAGANGWDYVCLDFGWALWENSEEKVRELCEYGSEKGVGIYLWYGVNNVGHYVYQDSAGHPAYPYYSLLDEATIVREFERISRLGVKGVKVDYYESDSQETMRQMYLCMDIAAKNHLMVLFHGCTMPHGESRTYPNVLSYEAVYGAEYYKWRDTPSLTNRITYPFTRSVAGSADFTPPGVPVDGIRATAGFALSDVVTLESGVQHFAQSVYTYEGSPSLPFLNDVPAAWDDMKVLDGYPMSHNVIARRKGNDWYIGAATIAPRTVTIPLNELISDNGSYTAYIYGDDEQGREVKLTVLKDLTNDSVITQELLPNGGFAMKLTKGTMKLTTPYSNYQFFEAENASISGIASVSPGKYCSGNAYVGYVGGGGAVTFDDVYAEHDGDYTLRIYYISGERRNLQIDVNGAHAVILDGLYANQNDWSGVAAINTVISLKAGRNSIRLYNDNGFAPSIDRIAIVNAPDEPIKGDVNADGVFNLADVVMMQKFLLKVGSLIDWKAGDLYEDARIDVFDLVMMKRLLLTK